MPAAINLPLMNNDERAAVGICYKRQGYARRWHWGINWWRVKIVAQHGRLAGSVPAKSTRYSLLRPWRSRWHLVQPWLHDAGIDYPLVEGGYKALRQTAIQATIELFKNR